MLLSEFINRLENRIPLVLQESWDQGGLNLGSRHQEIKGVLFSYDVCQEVVEAAKNRECNLIVSHHPLRLSAPVALDLDSYEGRLIASLISNQVSIYACHTSHDSSVDSLNADTLRALGCTAVHPLRPPTPMAGHPAAFGLGAWGDLPHTAPLSALVTQIKNHFRISQARLVSTTRNSPVKRVAICTGSGTSLLNDAIQSGADLFITGDVKYHAGVEAKRRDIAVLDVGHFASEVHSVKVLKNICQDIFGTELSFHIYEGLSDVFTIV